jgi:hypothetical protein
LPSISGGDPCALFLEAYGASLAPLCPDQLLAAEKEHWIPVP